MQDNRTRTGRTLRQFCEDTKRDTANTHRTIRRWAKRDMSWMNVGVNDVLSAEQEARLSGIRQEEKRTSAPRMKQEIKRVLNSNPLPVNDPAAGLHETNLREMREGYEMQIDRLEQEKEKAEIMRAAANEVLAQHEKKEAVKADWYTLSARAGLISITAAVVVMMYAGCFALFEWVGIFVASVVAVFFVCAQVFAADPRKRDAAAWAIGVCFVLEWPLAWLHRVTLGAWLTEVDFPGEREMVLWIVAIFISLISFAALVASRTMTADNVNAEI